LGGSTERVTVGTEWTRHAVTANTGSSVRFRVGIRHRGRAGNLYVDAAQLEKGTNVTEFVPGAP
jgi:hypothetical protein